MRNPSKEEKLMAIDESIHFAMMTARIIVEEEEGTKDEMQEYLVNKCNEEFHTIFNASGAGFALMAFSDLMENMSTMERAEFIEDLQKHD